MSGIFLSPSRINFHDTPNRGGESRINCGREKTVIITLAFSGRSIFGRCAVAGGFISCQKYAK